MPTLRSSDVKQVMILHRQAHDVRPPANVLATIMTRCLGWRTTGDLMTAHVSLSVSVSDSTCRTTQQYFVRARRGPVNYSCNIDGPTRQRTAVRVVAWWRQLNSCCATVPPNRLAYVLDLLLIGCRLAINIRSAYDSRGCYSIDRLARSLGIELCTGNVREGKVVYRLSPTRKAVAGHKFLTTWRCCSPDGLIRVASEGGWDVVSQHGQAKSCQLFRAADSLRSSAQPSNERQGKSAGKEERIAWILPGNMNEKEWLRMLAEMRDYLLDIRVPPEDEIKEAHNLSLDFLSGTGRPGLAVMRSRNNGKTA
ncbi:hypothetical protein AC579_8505 [Pseudocercospora musae]|uniref:Uncharacterized protein n=1 Tax=Pseudocercospora musae TaxID=113226 RepID=A0A139IFS3_9PEZI|nr:hypothetical protein AC579_8505 [Pseudocercospora musae]